MKVQILVRLKPGVLDVQGKAVEQGLHHMGFESVQGVRVGKLIEFDVDESDTAKAKEQVQDMCLKLIANPVIEDFEIKERA